MLAQGRNSQDWQDLITKMVGFGAQGSDEDFTTILDYVNTNFPPAYPKINVNKSNAAQLASGLSLSADEAKALVDYRSKNGDFKTIDDLKSVPAVDPKKLDAAKTKLLF